MAHLDIVRWFIMLHDSGSNCAHISLKEALTFWAFRFLPLCLKNQSKARQSKAKENKNNPKPRKIVYLDRCCLSLTLPQDKV